MGTSILSYILYWSPAPRAVPAQSRHLGSWADQIKGPSCHLVLLTSALQCPGPQPWSCPFLSTLLLLGLHQLCLPTLCQSKETKFLHWRSLCNSWKHETWTFEKKINIRWISLYLTQPSRRTPLTLTLLPLSLKIWTADTWRKMFNLIRKSK